MKYRKRPIVIEAVQLLWETWSEMCDHAQVGRLLDNQPEGVYLDGNGNVTRDSTDRIGLAIPTFEGLMIGKQNDWIIKGIQGEIYPCDPDIFAATYEPVEE
jgi:hypothetical protein